MAATCAAARSSSHQLPPTRTVGASAADATRTGGGVGNIPAIGRTYMAFRDAVRSLYNFADFESEILSSGFQGIVYKVTDQRTRQVMVLKKNKEKSNRKRSLQEIQILNKLDHPNIVRYVGACVWEGQLHPLTEFVNGGSMYDLLRDKTRELSWNTKMKFARDIALGMAYLHSKKFYHRDLASKNCLLRKSDNDFYTAVVADFGLAGEIPLTENDEVDEKEEKRGSKRISVVSHVNPEDGTNEVRIDMAPTTDIVQMRNRDHEATTRSKSGSMKRVQSIVGTTYWMAPEVLHGKFYSEKVDVFSYSIVLCEIIARVDADPDILKRTNDFGLDGNAFREQCHVDGLHCPKPFMELVFQCSNIDPTKRPPFNQIGPYLNRSLKETPSSPIPLRPQSAYLEDSRRPSFSSHLRVKLRSPSPENDVTHPSLSQRHSIADLSKQRYPDDRKASSASPRSLRRSVTLKISNSSKRFGKVKAKTPTFRSFLT
ncbi:dual specificity testis-specific protein kinase 1-like [Oscarella lobularis]|uniref:dual specificity testis-specific protein kinase 1-like n=1 Tax=Oscarella lobularis TaxID=121494 RepID=UPI00331336DA